MENKIKHFGTKIIKTERLVLRKFKESDYLDMYNNWASYKEVADRCSWPVHQNKEVTKELVKMFG